MNSLPVLLSALMAFAATLSAGIFVKKFKTNIGVVCAFAAGFFIALSLIELLPDILSRASTVQISIEQLSISALAGFFFLLALDQGFSMSHLMNHSMERNTFRPRIGVLSTMEFCSHGFIEGLAIGASFQLEFNLGILVTIAVISHDFCDGIITLALMLSSGNTLNSSIAMLFVDAIAPVLGAVTALFFAIGDQLVVLMLSFLAGSFLYMGGGRLLPDANRMNRRAITIAFFALGIFLVLLFARTL